MMNVPTAPATHLVRISARKNQERISERTSMKKKVVPIVTRSKRKASTPNTVVGSSRDRPGPRTRSGQLPTWKVRPGNRTGDVESNSRRGSLDPLQSRAIDEQRSRRLDIQSSDPEYDSKGSSQTSEAMPGPSKRDVKPMKPRETGPAESPVSHKKPSARKGRSKKDKKGTSGATNTEKKHPVSHRTTRLIYRQSTKLQAPLLVCGLAEEAEDVHDETEVSEDDDSPLLFEIPAQQVRDAMQASRSTPAAYWRYNLYRGPSGEKVILHYCRNRQTTETVAQLFTNKDILGFDIEWKPNAREGIKNNVSLIQIACEDRIALFHVALFRGETLDELVPPTLKKILESADITKVGVAIRGDCTRLRKFLGIETRAIFELSHLYKLVKYSEQEPSKVDRRPVSLAQQVEEHLQLPLFKGEVRESDWTKELSWDQCVYAASDAYAGYRLFRILETKRRMLQPVPPRPAHAELGLPIQFHRRAIPSSLRGRSKIDEAAAEVEELVLDVPADQADAITDGALIASVLSRGDETGQLGPMTGAAETSQLGTSESGQSPLTSSAECSKREVPVAAELQEAEAWVDQWRSTLPLNHTAKASRACLRAYALWHHQSFGLDEVAKLLRDPPLQMSTVASYVLESIRMENLPYDLARMEEPLRCLPSQVVQTRYRRLSRRWQEKQRS